MILWGTYFEETYHCKEERCGRLHFIEDEIGFGKPLITAIIDKHHKNGSEIHTLTDTGIVIIQNKRTEKIITYKIANPYQVKQLYRQNGKLAPDFILEIAVEHVELGYNWK